MSETNLDPWDEYVQSIRKTFENDADIELDYDVDNYRLDIYCENNQDKAYALSEMLPIQREYGDVILRIRVHPSKFVITEDEEEQP